MGRKSIAHLKAFLKLPRHLLGRVRLIFLLSALVMAALPVPMILSRNAVGRPLQALAIAGLLWLCWWWIRGYKRANFPPLWYIPEGIAVCAAAVAVGNPLYAEGLVYTGLMFRSLYGTRRSVVVALLLYLGAFCGAVVISMSFTNVDLPLVTVLTQLPGLPLMAALLYVVAASIARYERATFREKNLREMGFKLVATSERESIYQATLDAALKLVEDTPEARVGLATGSEEGITVVASAGYRAAEIRGHSFNVHSLPELLRARLLEKQPVEVERPESSDLREALGLASRIRPFFAAPLFIEDNFRGIIGVTSASALSEESKEGLVALTSQVSLALESSALAEEAHQRKSEERFRSLVQNASDIIMVLNADGSVSYISPAVERVLGYKPEDIVGTDSFVPMHPDDMVRVQNLFADVASKPGVASKLELRLQHADGSWRHLESSCTNLLHDPTVSGLVVNSRNITKRRQAEEALRESEEKFRLLAENARDVIFRATLQPTPRVEYISPSVTAMSGYEPEEYYADPHLGRRLVHPEDRQMLDEALRSTSGSPIALRWLRKDGGVIWAEQRNNPIYDEAGELVAIEGIVRDITKRKRAEEKLQRRESELTEAQRIAHVGNWSFDITRNEGHWSDEMYRTFGFAPQEFPITYKNFLNLVHPNDKDLVRKAVRAAFYEDRDWHSLDYRLIRPDGAVRSLHSQYKIVQDESERSIKIVGTSQDVTERKQAEEELRKSEERFRRLVEQAADALLVHDLRGRFVEVNQQACKSLGYTQEELLTMSVSDIEENFDPQGLEELWEHVVSSGSIMIDGVHRRKDGTRFPVEIRVGLFETGKERLMLAVARDITERKRAEEALRESEERYRAVVQQAVEGMFLVDLSTKRILEANDAYRALLGYDTEEMLGLTLYDVVAHDRKSIDFHVRQIVDEGSHMVGERYHRRKDSSLVEVEATASLISYGGRSAMSIVAHDVTERKRAEEELRKSEARNRAILEATPDLMFRVSRDGEYLDFRANDDSKLFIPREEIVGKTLRETMPPELVIPMLHHVAKTLDTGETQIFDYQLPVAGDMLNFEARLVVSGPGEVLSIVQDVTERKALERRLEHQAFHDALTGLPNRALFLDRLKHSLSRSGRRHESVAVLFIDLDNFKVINDSLGHEAGDELLIAVAVRLQGCLRAEDTLARLGGDEFTILIEDIGGTSDATDLAERIAQALREPFVLERQEIFVTASVGVTLDDSLQDDLVGGLLRSADLAMYRAKDNGKARYEVFDPDMNARALERLRLENDLRRALESNELKVYYQPKLQLVERNSGLQRSVESTNGRAIAVPAALPNPWIVGMEALVRWEHPELGLVLPSQFIPIAEETGLIVPMGRWVLREACWQARQWQRACPSNPSLTMSVNLSAREFQQPDLAEAVAEILDETGLSPGSLDLEITESLLMEDTERTVGTLRALKGLGVQLSIDDFGTGYSSLSYLDRFPVDNLKIDRTFVEKLGKSHKDTVLVSTAITLSHDFGLKAIAEGLENADQLQRLRELRCDQAQGYYFSKPLPSQEMSAMLMAGLESKVGGLPD